MEEKNMNELLKKAEVLIEALPYIQRFNRKIIVVKYGGSAMVDEELKQHVIQDVTLLKLVGFKPIIVHGGGKEISRWVEKAGMEPEFVNGLRKAEAREQARKEEAERLERERIAEEQRRIRQAKKEKERKQRNKRVKAFFFNKKNLALEFATSDLVGDSVDSVVEEIKEAGFNNYKTVPIRDIYVGNTKYVGEVEQVLINGQSWLAEGTMVPYDAEIIITFHVKKEFEFPYSARQMINRDFAQLASEFVGIGFTEVYTLPLKDLTTGWIKKERAVQQVLIEGIDTIKKGMPIEHDKKITIQYHSFKDR